MSSVFASVLDKDLHHRWPYLLLWLVILAVYVVSGVVDGIAVYQNEQSLRPGLWTLPLMYLFRINESSELVTFLSIIFVPLFIQSDPIESRTAFWITRPISSSALLRAKLFLVGIFFVLLPAFAELLILIANSLHLSQSLFVLLELMLVRSAIVSTSVFFAAIAGSFANYLIALLCIYFIGGLFGGVAAAMIYEYQGSAVAASTKLLVYVVYTSLVLRLLSSLYQARTTAQALPRFFIIFPILAAVMLSWPFAAPMFFSGKETPKESDYELTVDINTASLNTSRTKRLNQEMVVISGEINNFQIRRSTLSLQISLTIKN